MKDDWKAVFPAEGPNGSAPEAPKPPSAGNSAAAALENIKWRLVELGGNPAEAGRGPGAQITFSSKDHTIAANTGVNALSGTYSMDGERLSIAPGPMTRMAGSEPLMNQERAFIDALKRVTSYRASGNTLELVDGDVVLVRLEATNEG
jgi:heat shock protein HslJ